MEKEIAVIDKKTGCYQKISKKEHKAHPEKYKPERKMRYICLKIHSS